MIKRKIRDFVCPLNFKDLNYKAYYWVSVKYNGIQKTVGLFRSKSSIPVFNTEVEATKKVHEAYLKGSLKKGTCLPIKIENSQILDYLKPFIVVFPKLNGIVMYKERNEYVDELEKYKMLELGVY